MVAFDPHSGVYLGEASPGDVYLRDVEDDDVGRLFEFQCDSLATQMAAVPSRDRDSFTAHWARIRADDAVVAQTIVADGEVAGDAVSWEEDGRRFVGYWVGRPFWGRGIATRALALLLEKVTSRPLYAYVAAHNVGSARVLEKGGFERVRAQLLKSPLGGDDIEEYMYILRA